jgi:protein-tyrosine phosphatase
MTILRRALLTSGLAFAAASGAAAAPASVRVAFVDTGNTGRSLMAEVLSRDLAARRGWPLKFISRGLEVDPWDERPEANAAALLVSRGLSVAGHRARPVEARDLSGADVILTMTQTHREKVIALDATAAPRVHLLSEWAIGAAEPIPDAWGKPMAAYQAVIDQLDRFLPPALERAAKLTPRAP